MVKIETFKIKNWVKVKEIHEKSIEGVKANLEAEKEQDISQEYKNFLEYFLNNYDAIMKNILTRDDVQKLKFLYSKIQGWELSLIEEYVGKNGYISSPSSIKANDKDFIKKKLKILYEEIDNEIFQQIQIESIMSANTVVDLKLLVSIIKKNLNNYKESLSNSEVESLKKIFNYKTFRNKYRHSIISLMDIRVCPYCQRNYITKYKDENEKKTTADLDHFYSQSEFPYLALSLYNFIPSCQICNSRMKGSISAYKEDVLYPYNEGFEAKTTKAKFKTNIPNLKCLENEFKILIEPEEFLNEDEKKRVDKTIKMFKLNKIYETSHNSYIKEMLYNIKKYPNSRKKEIENLFRGKEIINQIELETAIKKPYIDRIKSGEPLAKLTKDILEEYKEYID